MLSARVTSFASTLTSLLRRLFPVHIWEKSTVDGVVYRTCTVCEQCEEYDYDDWGRHYVVVRGGDIGKHC